MIKPLLAALCLALAAGNAFAERTVSEIAYPISLLGTEMEGEPDGEDDPVAAMIMNRMEITQGAYPESLFQAVAAPVRFTLAGDGFPKESNLIVLCRIQVEAAWGEKEHSLVIDATRMAKTEKTVFMTPQQVIRLVVKAMRLTLEQNSPAGDTTPIRLTYKLPKGVVIENLPEVLLPKK